MLSTIKSFLAPLLATTILTMGVGLLNSLLSINMSLYGYSEQVIGLVMSCNYIGIVLGIFICQPIVHRVGHIRAFAVFAAVITAVALMYGIYIMPWFWALLRVFNGLCVTGLFIVIESWLNEKVEPTFRGRLLSIYMILVYFGNGSGQFLLNVSNVQGKSIFMIAGILFAMCLIPISITRAVHPQPLKVPRYNLIKLFQLAPFSMVGSFTAGLINSSFYTIGPMFALKIGLQISQVSWFMSLTIWSGLLFQWPVGLLSDRLDRLTVLSIVGFLVMFVSVSIAMLGALNLGVLLLLTACFGVVFTIYPVAMARAQDNIEKEDIVPVSGALILFFGLGACFGPVLASSVIAKIGPWGLYYFTAICGGILGGAAWIFRKKLPGKIEDQVPFIPIPKTSPIVSTLDPRGDPYGYAEKKDGSE
ncbi:MAG: MFS transporter [Thermodesulfobacteriota bacterium]|nr:MFS transporter [Thermodesulfobacteriota bacterium]